MRSRSIALGAGAVLFAFGVVGAWHLLAVSGLFPPIFLPTPLRTFEALFAIEQRGALWGPLTETTIRMFMGWIGGACLGVLIGAATAQIRPLRPYLEPTLEFLRSLPAAAIIPPAVLFLGYDWSMSITVVVYGALWPVLLASYHGVVSVEPRLHEVAATLNMSRLRYFFRIAFPSALVDIFPAIRISLIIALTLSVVTEMRAAQPGIGYNILLAERFFRGHEIFAGMVILAILGLTATRILLVAERRILRWQFATR